MTSSPRTDLTPSTTTWSHPVSTATPGYGDTQWHHLHYAQAVRMGNRVDTSGQGGWDDAFNIPSDLDAEIRRACDNVERTLATVGASWRDVIAVDSFHVVAEGQVIGPEHTLALAEQFRRRTGDRRPIWTQVGVTALGAPGMRIEVRVTAVVNTPAGRR